MKEIMVIVTPVSVAAISDPNLTGPVDVAIANAPPASAKPATATRAKIAPHATYKVERKSTCLFNLLLNAVLNTA